MKKMFSILGAFCLGAFITIGVMACADGGVDSSLSSTTTNVSNLPRIVNYSYDFSGDGSIVETRNFYFDENGLLESVKLTCDGVEFSLWTFEYFDNKIVCEYHGEDGEVDRIVTITLENVSRHDVQTLNSVVYWCMAL